MKKTFKITVINKHKENNIKNIVTHTSKNCIVTVIPYQHHHYIIIVGKLTDKIRIYSALKNNNYILTAHSITQLKDCKDILDVFEW